jgi:P-type E1-E2 ATPase
VLTIDIPGQDTLTVSYALIDLNGTLTDRGSLIEGVITRISQLSNYVDVHILSSDTFGTLSKCAATLGVNSATVQTGADKVSILQEFGAAECVAIGNGSNDAGMLQQAALGIAVTGPEGASSAALYAADIACSSIVDALDLVLDPQALGATLRA